MPLITYDAGVNARPAAKTAAAEPHRVAGLPAIIGQRPFILSMVLGLAAGFAVLPVGGYRLESALVAFGALCVAAGTMRYALQLQREVESLEERILDERSYHVFVDSATEGFFRTTRDGTYLIANPALAAIYGYESPEHLTGELTDIERSLYLDSNRRKEFQALMAAQGTVQNFVSQIRRRDGAVIWISENARAVRDDDAQFLFYEGTVVDITAQIESQDAMRRALRETEEASRAKAAFLAAMSHELKTPLNAVIGFSDVMLKEIFGPLQPPRYVGYVSDIHDNGRRLLALINDILDLTRIEGRLIQLRERSVAVVDLVAAARDSALKGKQNVARIEIDCPQILPNLQVDPERLHQALGHLLSNAVKFTPADGRIHLSAALNDEGQIAIAVRDTGIGMEPDLIRYALEPFRQLDSRLSRRFEGAGLGLPLANALVRLHGGHLAIASSPGQGTTVTMTLPAGPRPASGSEPSIARTSAA